MKVLNIPRGLLLAICLAVFPTIAFANHISSTLDSVNPVIPGGVTSVATGVMTQRLYRDGTAPGTCDTPKGPPTQANMPGNFRYDAYTITPTVSGCVTISYHWYAGDALPPLYQGVYQVSVYSTFNPADPKANLIADSNKSVTFETKNQFLSFMATAATPYTVVVWRPFEGEGSQYLLEMCDSLARPADFDGDGFSDTGVFRPSEGTWYIQLSATNTTQIFQFGANGDIPVDGDFDGDGLSDAAIFRPSVGEWWIKRSSNGSTFAFQFGQVGDKPVPGDYDKDGITDAAFFRPSNGFWYVLRSSTNFMNYNAFPFGINGDIPITSQRK